MIVETDGEDYASLILGRAPRQYTLSDTAIAPAAVLGMLADVAAGVRAHFAPASWLIVEGGEVVGLCSITRPPQARVIDIAMASRPIGRIAGSPAAPSPRWWHGRVGIPNCAR